MIQASSIFNIGSEREFEQKALEIFRLQARYNPIYRTYLNLLKTDIGNVKSIADIPFLPVRFFKSHRILCDGMEAETLFSSSGTTGTSPSKHYVADISIYRNSFKNGFEHFYGDVSSYRILALLPGYLERKGSSLIMMVDELIKMSGQAESGFFLHDHEKLYKTLLSLENRHKKTILMGVTYALLDFMEQYPMQLKNCILMETGGMKGKRKEMVREELHALLKKGFGVSEIHSEYGMTELLSQAYSKGDGLFQCPPWMKVLARETNDPFSYVNNHRPGGINVIDLANIHSCSFIATDDLGKLYPDGTFEVLGRFDNSDIRGCNLMVT